MNQDAVKHIRELAQTTPYPVEAFLFVLQAMPRSQLPEGRQIDAAEFCWRFHDHALFHFGRNARQQLAEWNIRSTDDIGNIVYALIEAGMLRKSEQDSQHDFRDVFQFETAFRKLHENSQPTRTPTQWRLSSLFILTAVAAVALAGVAKFGLAGALVTLFAAWFVLIGAVCLYQAIVERPSGWLILVSFFIGLFFCTLGIVAFLSIILSQ